MITGMLLRLLAILTVCSLAGAGQGTKLIQLPASAPTAPSPLSDPFGRSTPRGTITGFIRVVHRGDFVSASRYMQLTGKQKANPEALARDLMELMDRYFNQPVASISDLPTGIVDDDLPLDQERIGRLNIGNEKLDIRLIRVNDPQAGSIWLISAETLDQVPALHRDMEKTWIERALPEPFLQYSLFGVSLAQWTGWVATIAIPLFFFSFLAWLCSRLLRTGKEGAIKQRHLEYWQNRLRWPVISVLTLAAHLLAMGYLGFSLSSRIVYVRCGLVALIIAVAWLLQRILALSLEHARFLMEDRRKSSTESLLLLGDRILKVVITLVAFFAILSVIGVDTKTALAGVGIGGVAVALGAQKTVENLLGGIFLLSDGALAVGDTCSISNRIGTIEDITLRSVRLRTLEQTLLSIPAGTLSQGTIENFATRGKILMQSNLQLRYGTTAKQIREILDSIQHLLLENPKIETQTARVRLIDFGARAIEVEVFAYVRTSDNSEFLTVRENLLLRIAAIVEAAGSDFAGPSQFVYLAEGGLEVVRPDNASRPDKQILEKTPTEASKTGVKLAG